MKVKKIQKWKLILRIMKVRASEIAKAIEEFAPLGLQAEWDNSGFTVGNPDGMVSRALIALNCSLEVMQEAVSKECDMLITHHPLIVHKPCLSILEGDVRSETIMLAIRHGITVYSSHTPLDKTAGGLNDIMASRLGLKDTRVLGADGFSRVGSLPRAMSAGAFVEKVKKAFGASCVRTSAFVEGKVSCVAVSSGGGQGAIADAVASGAQVLVTGDVTHHNFYCPDGFMVIDAGHHFTELPAIGLLEAVIKKKFPKFALLLSEADKSPIFYI